MVMKSVNGANIIVQKNGELGGIYLGSIGSFADEQALLQSDVKDVVSITSFKRKNISKNKEIRHLHINLDDHQDSEIHLYFEQTYKFIEEGRKRGNVLIHCFAGVSRSATILIAYLMRKESISYGVAKNRVKEKRKIIRPNKGFERQLREFQNGLVPKL